MSCLPWLFLALFGRGPEAPDVAYWAPVEQAQGTEALAGHLAGQPESVGGVPLWYANGLGRPADSAGLAHWDGMSPGAALVGLALSTEAGTGCTPVQPTRRAGWVDAGNGVYVPPILLEIRRCESGGNYVAANRRSSARGAYQFLRSSWVAYGHDQRYGVREAHLATPAQQDQAAVITWERDGPRPWNASRGCWA